ncbi:carbohydrate sulfotransferase 11-like [Oratosquilla oratoria]|uniref:carbohydrate sulfotransferase 11-like n=1 Tax=Oratosquilla oratoria TaxID=337810 RepID=UPI003F760C8D
MTVLESLRMKRDLLVVFLLLGIGVPAIIMYVSSMTDPGQPKEGLHIPYELAIIDNTTQGPLEEWEELQKIRRQELRAGCALARSLKNYAGDKFLNTNFGHFVVDDIHKTLYCYVPKVSCTTWKRIMMILTGLSKAKDPLEIPSEKAHEEGTLVHLSSYTRDKAAVRRRLQKYTKFIIVRDPMERLLSAYRNKLAGDTKTARHFKKRFGVAILKQYGNRNSSTGDGVTFNQFVDYVTDPSRRKQLNEHWAPYVDLCHPCLVEFDYIGKYETLETDAEFILRKIGAPRTLHFPRVYSSKTTSVLPEYLKTLTIKQIRAILTLFDPDFTIFKYNFNLVSYLNIN